MTLWEMLTHMCMLLNVHPENLEEIDNSSECILEKKLLQIEIGSIDHGQSLANHNFPPML